MAAAGFKRVPSMREVLDERGVFTGQRCSCCNTATLFRVLVGDGSDDEFLACQRCDVEKREAV